MLKKQESTESLPVLDENCGIWDAKLSREKSVVSSRRVFLNVPASTCDQIKENSVR